MEFNESVKVDEAAGPETIASKYQAVLIHAIRAETFETALYTLLLAGNIEISSSTITAGDSIKNIVGAKSNPRQWGVIISAGEIISAAPFDVASAADRTHGRSAVYTKNMRDIPIVKQIETAVTNRPSDTNNEIYIKSPRIAGVYFFESDKTRIAPEDDMEMLSLLKQIRIPIYRIKNGLIYSAQVVKGSLVSEENPLSPNDVIRHQYEIAPDVKDYMIGRLADNFVPHGEWEYLNYADIIAKAPGKYDILVKQAKIIKGNLRELIKQHLEFLRENFDGTIYRAVEIYALIDELRRHGIAVNEIDLDWVDCLTQDQYHNFVSHLRDDGGFKASRKEVEAYLKTGQLDFFEQAIGLNEKVTGGVSSGRSNVLQDNIIAS